MTALLALPDELREFLGWMVRQRVVTLGAVCDYLEGTPDICRQLLLALQEKGLVQIADGGDDPCYQAWIVLERRRTKPSDIWPALEE